MKLHGFYEMMLTRIHTFFAPASAGIEIHPKGSRSGSSTVIAINAGGSAYTDSTGKLWVSDTGYYNTGRAGSYSAQIAGTNLQTIYQSERYDVGGSPQMKYSIPLVNGQYGTPYCIPFGFISEYLHYQTSRIV